MIITKNDLTPYAIEIGLWDALLEEAEIGAESEGADEAEIEIIKAKRG